MTLSALCFLLSTVAAGDAPGTRFAPTSLQRLFADPGTEQVVRFRLVSGKAEESVVYRVVDYAGQLVNEGQLRQVGPDHWEMSVRARLGYTEIELPRSRQRFGMISLPAGAAQPDSFFAIDGGLSWLVPDSPRREQLIKAAKRCGISMIRERLSWSAVNPDRDRWNLDGSARYASLRQFYEAKSIPILELAHDSPGWLGFVGKYPHDLVETARSWVELSRTWASSWGGLEIWNEPDIAFGGDLPADQYAAIAKAVSFSLANAGLRVPIVGGAMAYPNPEFLETSAQSGLLDRLDAFSFHHYGAAEEMQGMVERYRQWLIRSGHGAMPLWITECGRPWSRGPDRPPLAEDQKSALDIVMKGVEARASGIARYFPFVYPFYEENSSDFGMTDRSGTPLRSLAAYAQMIRVLANQRYIGDLPRVAPAIFRARVFGDGRQTIAVLYTGRRPVTGSLAPLGFRIRRIEGIDGRPLAVGTDGCVPVPDGLSYVWLENFLDLKLIDGTAAARPQPLPATVTAALQSRSSVVLRLRLDETRLEASARGYRIKQEPAGSLPLGFEVWNLGEAPRTLRLRLTLESLGVRLAQPERSISSGARSCVVVDWTIDASSMLARRGRLTARIAAVDNSGLLDSLAIVLSGEPVLARTLAEAANPVALPIRETKRWTPNASSPGAIELESTGVAWRLRVKDEQGKDRWAYPLFQIPPGVRLDRASGLIIRARCSGRATVRVLLWEGDPSANVVYLTSQLVLPTDGRWHVARISFQDLVPSAANSPDPDGHLDLARVGRLSVGMNPQAGECTLEVSDLCLVGDAAR
jgi:hypothetical protein